MNIYFDTEFTGLEPGCELISIGCVAETGEKFYAEFTDYDISKCSDWVKENVLKNLKFGPYHTEVVKGLGRIDNTGNPFLDSTCVGDSEGIKNLFAKWLEVVNPKGERIQFVSDVCHYDFYLLVNQIFKGSFNLPENVCPACYDICQDLVDEHDGDIKDMFDAFNYSREEACKFYNQGKLPDGAKHNSLYDAMVIKMIYEGMRR